MAQRNELFNEQIQEFRDAFDHFDEDNDGKMDLHELEFLMNALGETPSQEDLIALVREVGADEQHRITFSVFLTLMARKKADNEIEEELIESFKIFDKNGDGFIVADELEETIMNLGETLTKEEVQEMILEAD